jgi:hypothetical protein
MRKRIGSQAMLDHSGQQPACAAHHAPVIFEGRAAGQTDLVVAAMLVDARPRKSMRAGLLQKMFQKIHLVAA